MLNKILYRNETDDNNHVVNFRETLLNYVATNSVQTFDRRLKFSSATLKQKLLDMDFMETIQNLGYELSQKGHDLALIAYKINGEDYIDYAQVSSYVKIGPILTKVMLETQDHHVDENGVKHPIHIYFRFNENGSVIKSEVYILGEEIIDLTPTIDYMTNKIPVKIMKNNSLGTPDIPRELHDLLNEYEYYGSQLGKEWEKTKTQFLNNMLFGSTKDGTEWQRDIESGKFVHDVSDDDGKLQGALGTMISGSNTSAIVIQNIQFIEDKILKYAHQFRETNFSGNNKHNLEISQSNKQAFEYMMNKLEFRQRQLNSFFKIIGWDLTIQIKPSEIEEAKIQMMKAQINNMNSQAKQAKGVAKYQEANAKLVEQGGNNGNKQGPKAI